MSLMTPAEIKAHVETDLTDAALQELIDAAEQDIDTAHGALATQTDELLGKKSLNLWPTRPITTVTSITETVGATDTVLSADDYKLLHGGRQIERLSTGTNPRIEWGDRVKIVYAPEDETARRKGILVKLVKFDLAYNGLASEKVGDYSSQSISQITTDERARILSGLARFGGFV